MGLFDLITGAGHPRAEQVSLTSVEGWQPIFDSYGVIATATGERVSPTTATKLSAYFACITVVAEDCAKVPLCPFRKLAGGGSNKETTHPTYDLLMLAAHPTTTSVNFRQDIMASTMSWGHGYAAIGRDGAGTPTELRVLHPPSVWPGSEDGVEYYEVTLADGSKAIVWPEDMIHLRGPLGWSVARQGAASLGIALAEQSYAANYLGKASAPAGTLSTKEKLSDLQRKTLGREWRARYSGSKNAGVTPVLDFGVEYKQLSVNPGDAQLLEGRQFSVEEICRWFRVSPHKVMERSRAQGWSTHEITQNEHVSDALLPKMGTFEAELNVKLLTEKERAAGYYYKHVVQALMRADVKARGAWYSMMQRNGNMSSNEVRAFEDMNPRPGGDVFLVSANMVPAELVASGEAFKAKNAAPAGESSDKGGPGGDANDDPDSEARAKAAALHLLPVFEDAAGRLLRKETKALTRLASKHPADSDTGPDDFAAAAAEFFDGFAGDFARVFAAPAAALLRAEARATVDLSMALAMFGRTQAAKAADEWLTGYTAGDDLEELATLRVEDAWHVGKQALAFFASTSMLDMPQLSPEKG